MGKANLSKEHRQLRKLMTERGFAWTDETGKGHGKIRVTCPNGRSFAWIIPGTPSDYRSWINQTATLRRLLADAGYRDEREHLRVASDVFPRGVAMTVLFDFLDQLAFSHSAEDGV